MLRLLERAGAFDDPAIPEEQRDRPARASRADPRAAAAEGVVLLKNDGDLLPLNPEQLTSIAMIGPNATRPRRFMVAAARRSTRTTR